MRLLEKIVMISVCLATYNGMPYLPEQINSILSQLSPSDEVVISDDHSTDNTIEYLKSLNDDRIKIHVNRSKGFVSNFENAMRLAQGDYIFLSDQDDIWMPNKVKVCMEALQKYSLVNHNSQIVDAQNRDLGKDFFTLHGSKQGYWQNLLRNSYVGCCMAFRRELLFHFLPFPPKIASHDIWMGLMAERRGNPTFISEPLIRQRRHGGNTSSTSEPSRLSKLYQLQYRWYMFWNSLKR